MDHKLAPHHEGTHGLHHTRMLSTRLERVAGHHSQRSARLHEHQSQAARPQEQQEAVLDRDFLRKQARWIRDDLDPQVARDGPDVLHSDDVLDLDQFLRSFMGARISVEVLRYSRIHLAIATIAGRATRWPARLVPRCDALKDAWEAEFGALKEIGTLLYEPGGRLHGVCSVEDLSRDQLMAKWFKSPEVERSPMMARRFGDLGFKPGDWWINPSFAMRDGIIDNVATGHGIVADAHGAYAVVMTDQDEDASPTPDAFTYRARHDDKGRYRLTIGTPDSRAQVRILRSHTLRSFWSPKAGLRYDGLHKVTGWSIKFDPVTQQTVYCIKFKRLPTETDMETVLRRPWLEEVEDYKEYKRLRQLAREKHIGLFKSKKIVNTPTLTFSADGAVDSGDGTRTETRESGSGSSHFVDELVPKLD